jgi:DNA-binding NtrC family response regulator
MANILTVGKITPHERVCAMLQNAGHLLSSVTTLEAARCSINMHEHDVVILGERMTTGERELVLEMLHERRSCAKVIFLYEFFLGNARGADAIVDIALGFDYLPDVVSYLTVCHGSIRPKSSKIHTLRALRALA